MQTLVSAKIASLHAAMTDDPLQTILTPALKVAVLRLLTCLDASDIRADGGSETQQSSSKTEKAALAMLGVPLIQTLKKKEKNPFSLPMSAGDFFGYKRVVKHNNECRFVLPEADGVYAIHQPYGSQANPDILLIEVHEHKLVCQFGIEIKSGGPTWNTHIQTADRSMLYVAIKDRVHYFFGDHIRDKDSLVLALAWDELQRELADVVNAEALRTGRKNMCVPYPKQEFRGLNLDEGRDTRHAEIKQWLA